MDVRESLLESKRLMNVSNQANRPSCVCLVASHALAIGHNGGLISLHNTRSRTLKAVVDTRSSLCIIQICAVTPTLFASISLRSHEIMLWDVATAKLKGRLRVPRLVVDPTGLSDVRLSWKHQLRCLTTIPGQRLACSMWKTSVILVFNIRTRRVCAKFDTLCCALDPIVCFVGSHTLAVTAGYNTHLQLWDVRTSSLERALKPDGCLGLRDARSCAATQQCMCWPAPTNIHNVSRVTDTAVAAVGFAAYVVLYDAQCGQVLQMLRHSDRINDVIHSVCCPGAGSLVTSTRHSVCVWRRSRTASAVYVKTSHLSRTHHRAANVIDVVSGAGGTLYILTSRSKATKDTRVKMVNFRNPRHSLLLHGGDSYVDTTILPCVPPMTRDAASFAVVQANLASNCGKYASNAFNGCLGLPRRALLHVVSFV